MRLEGPSQVRREARVVAEYRDIECWPHGCGLVFAVPVSDAAVLRCGRPNLPYSNAIPLIMGVRCPLCQYLCTYYSHG